ncbi:uncharacterized protein LOC8036456 isoform X1 [Ixodes scapularis]|uniref:uncharacterized protein LOC8036456 isoform X1 n=1 Tax=Ixodes scapularis TaxID=6945 RepID=UPI001C38757E|nr:uncharacterized protein LOC8036456 isoform X1 [Ixodes scapularis]
MQKCLSPGCNGQTGNKKLATCNTCRKVNCHSCHAIHEGIACRVYQQSISGGERLDKRGKITEDLVKTEARKQGEDVARNQASPSKLDVRNQELPKQSTPTKCSANPSGQELPKESADSRASPKRNASSIRTNSSAGTRVEVLDANSERLVECFDSKCGGQGFIDQAEVLFKCPVCNRFNCVECKAIHESLTCNEYKQKKREPSGPIIEAAAAAVGVQDDLEEQELEEPDDGAEGRIVNCKAEGCNSYGFVDKSATVSQCFTCDRWTCIRCNECHESNPCPQYKPVDDDEYKEAVEEQSRGDVAGPSEEAEQNVGHDGRSEKQAGKIQRLKDTFNAFFSSGGAGRDPQRKPNTVDADSDIVSPGLESMRTRAQQRTSYASAARKAMSPQKAEDHKISDCCRKELPFEILPECEHKVCRVCITKAVKETVTIQVTCPVPQATVRRCRNFLSTKVIKDNVPDQVFKHWKEMKKWNRISCQVCQTELLRNPKKKTVDCPRCGRTNCLSCCAVHVGMDCRDYIQKLVNDLDRAAHEDPEEKRKRFQEQLDLYSQDAIQATEEFDCAICFISVEPEMGLILKNCHHQICKDCLVNIAKNSSSAVVRCPHDPCEMEISDTELRACLSPELYDELQERGLREAERTSTRSFHCKTVDCRGWCIYDEDSNAFECPVCKKINCLRCEAIHEKMNCAEYQEDLKRRAQNDDAAKASINMLEAELKRGDAMRCSKCNVILIKRGGCDAIRCASCNTELCWATKGPRWGPNGTGDTSGGCRCRVNGVLCHPNCGNCH